MVKNNIEVICIDDRFSIEARKVYEKYNIITPRESLFYSVREVVITRVGIGFLLEELVNPLIPIGEGENGFMVEPNFNVSRFANLDGTEINTEQLIHETKDTGVTT